MSSNALKDACASVVTPIHPAGIPFIGIFAVVTLIFFALSIALGFIGLILTGWCVYFFRNPNRVTPTRAGLVVSPADGKVQMITKAVPPSELQLGSEPKTRISIFLNVFNVHVNRVPIEGKITALHYHPGKFLSANLDKASEENERQSATVTTADGKQIGFVQIAGLIARRILCDLKHGQDVKSGEQYGIIRFGSRMDIFLPDGVNPLVLVGQTAVGGETVLADLNGSEPAREGVTH